MRQGKLLGILLAAVVLTDTSAADEKCRYTSGAMDKLKMEHLQNKNFARIEWDSASNSANILTRDGYKLSLSFFACEHYAVEGKLFLTGLGDKSKLESQVVEKILWLGEQMLKPEDIPNLKKAVTSKEYRTQFHAGEVALFFSGHFYPQISLHITSADKDLAKDVVIDLLAELE